MNLQQFYYFLLLCRPVNLLIIALTMYLIHINVIGNCVDLLENDYIHVGYYMNPFDFFLLVFSTVLIAGAGYIINDYFDMRIDRINKPDKVIVGKHIKKRIAMLTHTAMNLLAVLIGIYLSFKYHTWLPLAFHIVTTSVLWWYSVMLKRKFLSGNISIAVLSGMVPLLVGWIEIPALKEEYLHLLKSSHSTVDVFKYTWLIVLGYSILAAVTTLIREIIKDAADIKGDETIKCKTIPIVLGIEKTKYIINLLLLITLFSIIGLQVLFFPELTESVFIMSFVCLPLLAAAVVTHYATGRKQFLLASNFIKISMFSALLFTFLIRA